LTWAKFHHHIIARYNPPYTRPKKGHEVWVSKPCEKGSLLEIKNIGKKVKYNRREAAQGNDVTQAHLPLQKVQAICRERGRLHT
jgi:hypothetical protein